MGIHALFMDLHDTHGYLRRKEKRREEKRRTEKNRTEQNRKEKKRKQQIYQQ